MNPLVSIIIPAYNCEAWIGECLESVLAQTYTDWECIVVDDGSADGTFAVAQGYAARDSRIRCYHQENQGPSVARNTAVSHSSGEYILPVDADDRIAPSYVEKAITHMMNYPETTLVNGTVKFFGLRNGIWQLPPYKYEDFIWGNVIICGSMFKRSDFDRVGGYNPNMRFGFEDWDLWLSILNKDSIVYHIDEVVYYYRQMESSRSSSFAQYEREVLRQLCLNHKDVYSPYFADVVYFRQKAGDVEYYVAQCDNMRRSHAYQLGKFLMRPFSFLRKRFAS